MAAPWSLPEALGAAKKMALNCISVSDSDIQKSISLLRQACLDSGFFYVVDHGISQEFINEVFFQSKRFFDLPLHEKMKLLRNEKHRGYTPTLDEHLDPKNQVQGDYKEGYYIGVEVPEDDPQALKPFYGPNQWPSEEILPGWRKVMEQYHKEALRVSRAVAKIIALALDLDTEFFEKPQMLGEPIATLRLLRYEGAKEPLQIKFLILQGEYMDAEHILILVSLLSWLPMMLWVFRYARIRMPNLKNGNMWLHLKELSLSILAICLSGGVMVSSDRPCTVL